MPKNPFSKKQWGAMICISLILISTTLFIDDIQIKHEKVVKIEWYDIGHVIYVLPLFNSQQWLYRYDVKTNNHGIITLREDSLPQPNIITINLLFNACSYTSFTHHLTVNETIGLTFYTNCGYLVIPQVE